MKFSGKPLENPVVWLLTAIVGWAVIVLPSSFVFAQSDKPQSTLQVAQPDSRFEIPPGIMVPVEPRPLLVPDLHGRNLKQAREILKESGLQIGNIQPIVPGYIEGPVVRQRPAPGANAARGSRVDLVLGGPRQVEVPNIIGRSVEVAFRILERSDLQPGTPRERVSASQTPGTVIDQDPPAGAKVIVGSSVGITTAVAPKISVVSVPDLIGLTPREANSLLGRRRLVLGVMTTMPSEHKENTIFSQEPLSGDEVESGTEVNVFVAVRMRVEVPHLIDQHQSRVESILSNAQLFLTSVRKQESEKDDGTVLDQRPMPGELVEVRTGVDILVAERRARDPVIEPPFEDEPPDMAVPVPDVIGQSFSKARLEILTAGLAVGNLTETASGIEAGTILQQNPVSRIMVAPGTAVNLSIAVAKPLDILWPGIAVIVLAVATGGALMFRKRPGKKSHEEEKAPQTELEIKPRSDPGTVRIEPDQPLDQDFELRLRAVGDPGIQGLEPRDGLIQQERKKS